MWQVWRWFLVACVYIVSRNDLMTHIPWKVNLRAGPLFIHRSSAGASDIEIRHSNLGRCWGLVAYAYTRTHMCTYRVLLHRLIFHFGTSPVDVLWHSLLQPTVRKKSWAPIDLSYRQRIPKLAISCGKSWCLSLSSMLKIRAKYVLLQL